MRDDQLKWVQQNHRPKDGRCQSVGAVSRSLLDSPLLRTPAWRRRLLAVLQEVGPELLEQVEVVSARNGILTLHVEDPALSYHLRLQWEQRVLQALSARLPGAGIHAIRFTTREPG
jgi:hypothetical protein